MGSRLRRAFCEVHQALVATSDPAIAEVVTQYALVVIWEDVIVNGVLDDRRPLALSNWRSRTGLSELPPIGHQRDRGAWAARVRIDQAALRCYARAVYAATDAYLARHAAEWLTARVLEALLVNQTRVLYEIC